MFDLEQQPLIFLPLHLLCVSAILSKKRVWISESAFGLNRIFNRYTHLREEGMSKMSVCVDVCVGECVICVFCASASSSSLSCITLHLNCLFADLKKQVQYTT